MSIISPAELTAGMHITVLEWLPEQIDNPFSGLLGGGGGGNPFQSGGEFGEEAKPAKNSKITIGQKQDYCGEVLTVLAVDLPFIALKMDKSSGSPFDVPIKLDSRKCKLMELTKDYVDAMHITPIPDVLDSFSSLLDKLAAIKPKGDGKELPPFPSF